MTGLWLGLVIALLAAGLIVGLVNRKAMPPITERDEDDPV